MAQRCEDFPCCGHYEPSTGESFCREATMSREEREDREEQGRIDAAQRALDRKIGRRALLKKAPVEHDDETCGEDDKYCRDCLIEGWDSEYEYNREQDYA